MLKKNKANIIIVCLIVFIVPIIALLIPKNQQIIENAIVNSQTGDIAIVYYNYDNGGTIELFLYDVEGTLLFTKSHPSNGGSHSKITFVGTDIHLYVSRTDIAYAYSREGCSVEKMSVNEWKNISLNEWVGWESERGSKRYMTKNHTYFYEKTPFPESLLNSKCSVKIYNKKMGTTVVLFEFK